MHKNVSLTKALPTASRISTTLFPDHYDCI
jgi:hypothetical protein